MLVAAFIFLAPGADPAVHRKTVETPGVALTAIGVETIDQAVAVAKEMADAGCGAIELCGGFGIQGTALIDKAVAGKARIGAVRVDLHPGLDNKSGDEIFL